MFEKLELKHVKSLIEMYDKFYKNGQTTDKFCSNSLESAFLLLYKPELNINDLPDKIIFLINVKEQKIPLIKFSKFCDSKLGLKEAKEKIESIQEENYEIVCEHYFYYELLKVALKDSHVTFREIFQYSDNSEEEE